MSTGSQACEKSRAMDWPLSRDEKRACVLRLYESDVQAANALIRTKDREIRAASKELQHTRRMSLDSKLSQCPQPSDSQELAAQEPELAHGCDAGQQPVAAAAVGDPTCDRDSSSLRARRPTPRARSVEHFPSGRMREEQQDQQRGKTWWVPAWDVVRRGAQLASASAADFSKAVLEEARILGGDLVTSSDTTCKAPTHQIEWRVEMQRGEGRELDRLGLTLRPHEEGKGEGLPLAVMEIAKGFALDRWNSDVRPITVILLPSRREAVMRHISVQSGDEIVEIDGVALVCSGKEDDRAELTQRIRRCRALTMRREVRPRCPQKAPTGGS